MTSKLIITIEENYEIAEKILKGWQAFVYKKAAKALAGMLYNACKKYKFEKKDNKTIFIEEGDDEYIELQKRKFENFMFSEEKELKTDKYKQYRDKVNNRFIGKVLRGAHKFKGNIKNKALNAALGGTDVLSFFTKLGIFVIWKTEKSKVLNRLDIEK